MNIKSKVLSIIMVAVTLCGALLSNPLPVHASSNTLDTSTKTGYSYHGVSPHAGEQQFSNFSIMKLNGQPVFCVESHVMAVDGGGYVPETLVNGKKDLLAKIAYYGYTNTSRTNVDYATTQIMIWETLGDRFISSSVPNYQGRKADIMAKVNKHDTLPSFNGKRKIKYT